MPLVVHPDTMVLDAISQMAATQSSYVLVAAETGALVGILTQSDIVRLIAAGAALAQLPLRGVMQQPVRTLPESALVVTGRTDITTILGRFEVANIRHLPVLDGADRLVGLLTQSAVSAILSQDNVGTLSDISGIKQAEIALEKSRQKYYCLIQSVNGIVWEYDRKTELFPFVSDKAEALLGYPVEAWLTEPGFWKNHIYAADRAEVERRFDEAIQLKISCEVEYRMVAADGRLIWLYDISSPNFDEQGNPTTAIGVLIDIRDRKEYEQRLERSNAELLQATHLKDAFLANMSHELRTPLNAILGMTECLQEDVFGETNPRQKKAIVNIERSGQHLLALISDILEVSKIAAGKLELEMTAVSVAHLCASSLAFVKQQAFAKKIQLTTDINPDLGEIQVDERRMRQVLINLLNNAVKFTPDRGCITLKVRRSAVGFDFSVIDTGIGIAPADQLKLFQPFVQIDSSLNRQYEGTGLGLALVNQIVQLHRGSVNVISAVGQGSCFTVQLPDLAGMADLNMADLTNALLHDDQPPDLSSGLVEPTVIAPAVLDAPLILLADDHQGNLETLSDYLEVHGYRLVLARDGHEAIALAQMHLPAMIVMDIQMPGVDGLSAIQTIRQDLQLVQVPIVALTALALDGDREKCLQAGANEYLTKPVKLKQLLTIVQQLLECQGK
jgi:PAS domain S-box-containing protein